MTENTTARGELAHVKKAGELATGTPGELGEDLAVLAPAAAAALHLLADAIRRGSNPDAVVDALREAGVPEAFAQVLDASSEAVMNAAEDPYDFDDRLRADNLYGAAIKIRDSFHWL